MGAKLGVMVVLAMVAPVALALAMVHLGTVMAQDTMVAGPARALASVALADIILMEDRKG